MNEQKRESAQERLSRMRRRLTLIFGLVSLAGIATLALVTTVIEGQLRDDRFNAELQGYASRAAALVFFDDTTGEWNTGGVIDDTAANSTDGILVYDAVNETELLATSEISAADSVISATLADGDESGTIGTVALDGQDVRAAGAPYFGDNDGEIDVVVGAVVAVSRGGSTNSGRLLSAVWGTAAALALLSAATAWLWAGRIVKPMGAQLDREEAFLATAAHELRTPLGRQHAVAESALLSARQLPASSTKDELAKDLRRLLELNSETATSIEDLLLLGRIEAGQLTARTETVHLERLVAQFEASFNELVVETSTPVLIDADPALVHHVISNLLFNAQRHGRPFATPLLIEASVESADEQAIVKIRDNGPGLTNVDAIFERHHTTSSSGGLGLWIVRTVVEEQGGTVSAMNHPSGGAIFELRWPLSNLRRISIR